MSKPIVPPKDIVAFESPVQYGFFCYVEDHPDNSARGVLCIEQTIDGQVSKIKLSQSEIDLLESFLSDLSEGGSRSQSWEDSERV